MTRSLHNMAPSSPVVHFTLLHLLSTSDALMSKTSLPFCTHANGLECYVHFWLPEKSLFNATLIRRPSVALLPGIKKVLSCTWKSSTYHICNCIYLVLYLILLIEAVNYISVQFVFIWRLCFFTEITPPHYTI